MLDTLTARLAGIVKQLRGEARLTETNIQEALREVRIALLEADVALPVAKHFIESVRAKALGADVLGSLTPGQALVGVVHRELTALMGEANAPLDLATQPPAIILMASLLTLPRASLTERLRGLPRSDGGVYSSWRSSSSMAASPFRARWRRLATRTVRSRSSGLGCIGRSVTRFPGSSASSHISSWPPPMSNPGVALTVPSPSWND